MHRFFWVQTLSSLCRGGEIGTDFFRRVGAGSPGESNLIRMVWQQNFESQGWRTPWGLIERNDSGEHTVQRAKFVDWKMGNVRKTWGEPSQLVALAMEAPRKAYLATLRLPALEMVERHLGRVSGHRAVSQQKALERRWKRRIKQRGLSFMTLQDEGDRQKKTIAPLPSFKMTLKSFLSWKKQTRKRMDIPVFFHIGEQHKAGKCCLRRAM